MQNLIVTFLLMLMSVLWLIHRFSVKHGNPVLDEIKDWQALLGALLGFFAIVAVLQVEYQNARNERSAERRQQEIGYLIAFTLEQQVLVRETRASFESLRSRSEPPESVCRVIIGHLADVPPKDYRLTNGYSEGYSKLSTSSQILVMDIVDSRKKYLDSITERTTRGQFCYFEPEEAIGLIARAKIRYITESDEQFDQLIERIEALERED